MEPSKNTILDDLFIKIKNRKFIAYLLLFGLIVINIGLFTEGLTTISKVVVNVLRTSEKNVANEAKENLESAVKVQILSPKDGEVLFLSENETIPVALPIKGDIVGLERDGTNELNLWVEVLIKTDEWYPQGIAKIENDGTWVLKGAHFGGSTHIIKAILTNKRGYVITSKASTVTIVQ